MNHEDLRYAGKIPSIVKTDGGKVLVPFTQEPSPEASWAAIASAVNGPVARPDEWPEPAHVAFANLDLDDPQAFVAFVTTYGISGRFCNRDEDTGKLFADPEYARRSQKELRALWGGAFGGVNQIKLTSSADDLSVELDGLVKVSVHDLESFIMCSFLIDRATDRTQVCQFSRCPRQRYFLKTRADQQFCSTQCRALHNRLLWRTDPKNVEREKKQRRKAARKKTKSSAA